MDDRTNVGVRVSGANLWWAKAIAWSLVAIFLLSGCGAPSDVPPGPQTAPAPVEQLSPDEPNDASTPEQPTVRPTPTPAINFGPVRIEILPLTELIESADGQGGTELNVFLAVRDAFGSPMKAPGTLRFELYEHVQRSAEPKGQRIAIWTDINLTDATENHRYWQDFLRAYEFTLRTDASRNKTYVLEATFLRPSGRLTTEWLLRPGN